MNRLVLVNLLFFLFCAQSAWSADLILGGQSVAPRDPVAASTVGVFSPGPLGSGMGSLCTGTLIKDDIALTAAHCVRPGAKPVLIFNRDLHSPGAAHRVAEGVSVNPQWHSHAGVGMDQGDIALVKFGGQLPSGYHPVSTVQADSAIHRGERVTLAGYGISNAHTHAGAGRLRRADVKVLDSRPGKTEMIMDQTHGRGACHGDSGGPAFVRAGNRIALAGLTNRSYPDSAPDDCAHDSVYTKVPAYKSWIQKNEKKLESAPPKGEAFRGHVHLRPASHRRGARLNRSRQKQFKQLAGVHRRRTL